MREQCLRIGDLVVWAPDGDIGIVTKVEYHRGGRERSDPFWIQWVEDPQATGWHGCDYGMLKLLSSI